MTFPLGFAENSIQLVPDGTLILHVIIILVMVFVLNATLYKPINRILEAREKRTRGRMSEAQEIMTDVSQKLANYERQLRQARADAYAQSEQERTAAMQARQQKLNETRAQLSESIAKEKQVIAEQAAGARGSLEDESRRLASEISSRVLNRREWLTNVSEFRHLILLKNHAGGTIPAWSCGSSSISRIRRRTHLCSDEKGETGRSFQDTARNDQTGTGEGAAGARCGSCETEGVEERLARSTAKFRLFRNNQSAKLPKSASASRKSTEVEIAKLANRPSARSKAPARLRSTNCDCTRRRRPCAWPKKSFAAK
jgi:F-type H+-transporting ATPase subunit b